MLAKVFSIVRRPRSDEQSVTTADQDKIWPVRLSELAVIVTYLPIVHVVIFYLVTIFRLWEFVEHLWRSLDYYGWSLAVGIANLLVLKFTNLVGDSTSTRARLYSWQLIALGWSIGGFLFGSLFRVR